MKCKRCGAELKTGQRYCMCCERSEDYARIVSNIEILKKLCLGAAIGLLGFAIVHLFMRDGDLSTNATITLIQLMRFLSLGLAFGGISGVTFCKYASIEYRIFTALVILGVFVTVWCFLFPAIPNSVLCYEFFYID